MPPGRRRFDHLVVEVSLAVGAAVPRFPLWVALREHGADPERLSRAEALTFCEEGLEPFLEGHALGVPSERARRRLTRRIGRFDARYPTPEERLQALTG